ncbi:MAG: hypothetical protein MOB07_19185, partial [Acidobacteria bacterium]|nr:hypothetical protein [Acidobacteriota bacterium]
MRPKDSLKVLNSVFIGRLRHLFSSRAGMAAVAALISLTALAIAPAPVTSAVGKIWRSSKPAISRARTQLFPLKSPQDKASISIAKKGYLPGETVTIRGEGFHPGEIVSLRITHLDGAAEGSKIHDWQSITVDGDGSFTASVVMNANDSFGHKYVVTAYGQSSQAKATFSQIALVGTNKSSYDPDETAKISGSFFADREPVTIQMTDSDGKALGEPMTVYADEAGRIAATMPVNSDSAAAGTVQLTAIGSFSGLTATASFSAPTLAFGSVGQCVNDRFESKTGKDGPVNCTANDVSLSAYTLVSGPTSCLPGDTIQVVLKGQFGGTANERYDIGVFIATDGGNARDTGGVCYNDFLHFASTSNNTDLNLSGGSGPFYNAEYSSSSPNFANTCGDVKQTNGTTFLTTQTVSIKCQDSNNDGTADVGTCTTWANQDNGTCTSELDTTAEEKSKCSCGNVPIAGLQVPKTGTIRVNKVLSPSADPGKFNLQIDGATAGTGGNVGNGGTTGVVTVSAGTVPPGTGASHDVGETAGTSTDLNDYTSSISCTSDQSHTASSPNAGPLSLTVLPDEDWICTITNTRKTGTLIVKKVVINDNGGTKIATDFQFSVDGGVASGTSFIQDTDTLHGKNTFTVNIGTYNVTEDNTPIAGYTTNHDNCSNVVITNGGEATCTITNDDIAPKLHLRKVVTNDNGGTKTVADFTLTADG